LLTEKQDDFMAEALAVLRTGLEISPWISEDDTGARHAGKNGYCTQIGKDWFTPAFAGAGSGLARGPRRAR
jgi:hypothetical protein